MASQHDVELQPDGTLSVTGKCPLSGKEWRLTGLNSVAYGDWKDGMLIQEAFPQLNKDQRELLITGITPEAWNQAFGEEE